MTEKNAEIVFGIKLSAEDHDIIRMVLPKEVDTMTALRNAIGCEWIEVLAGVRVLPDNHVLVVDDEGKFKDRPMVNVLASYLYGTHEHGDPIVGNAVIMKQVWAGAGYTLEWLTGTEVTQLGEKLYELWPTAVREILAWDEREASTAR